MRKNNSSFLALLFVVTISMLSFTQCKKKDKKPEPPTFGEITPAQAKVGETITISGTNFNTIAANNTVTFTSNDDETKATITKATATDLEVTVPDMPHGTVKITITANEQTTAPVSFKIVAQPEITSFTGNNGSMGDEVVITGKNFMAPGTVNPIVTINGKEQEVTSASDTEIKIKLAAKTFSGDMVIKNPDEMVSESKTYTYKSKYTFNSTPFITGYVDWITYTPEGDFYAVTGDRAKVQKFKGDGTWIADILDDYDNYGPEYLWLADDGTLYLTEYFGRIFKMDTKTETAFSLFVNNTDPLALKDQMKQISGDNNGTLYFGSGSNSQILKVDAKGAISEVYKNTKAIFSLQYLNDKIYCATSDEVFSVDTSGNSYKEYVNSNANGGAGFNSPSLCMCSEEDMYVAKPRKGIYKVNTQDASLELIISDSDLGNILTEVRMIPTPEGDIVICILSGAYKLTRE